MLGGMRRNVLVCTGLLLGCSSGGGGGPETLATVQQRIPVATFQEAVASDPALAKAVDLAKTSAGVTTVARAGRLEDAAGVTLLYGAMTGPGGEAVVVRHCDGKDCISVVQRLTADGGDVTWRTDTGPVPVRTVRMPLQLRIIDEADPDATAVLGTRTSALMQAQTADDTTPRRLRVLSAFNQYMTFTGPNFNDTLASMKKGGFPDSTGRYGVKAGDFDSALSTLGPRDAVMLLAHGDQSKSKGRVVGMSVNADWWGAEHYSESRIAAQLAKNTSGGPGIIFLAGCKTADMLDTLDSGSRVVLGFEGKIEPGLGSKIMKQVFDELGKGKTLKEALEEVNGVLVPRGLGLRANKSANLDIKLVNVGAAGSCDKGLAGSYSGTLVVTKGTARVMAGLTQRLDCGMFVTKLGDDAGGTCKGCFVDATYVARKLAGCASTTTASLTQFDQGASISMELNLVTSSQLSVTIIGDDSDKASFTRSGTLSRCP